MPWTKETAAEAGRKGAAAAKRTRERRKADPLWEIKASLPQLFSELLRASRGEGSWDDLSSDKRMDALKTCLAYGMGRPVTTDKQSKEDATSDGGGREAAGGLQVE